MSSLTGPLPQALWSGLHASRSAAQPSCPCTPPATPLGHSELQSLFLECRRWDQKVPCLPRALPVQGAVLSSQTEAASPGLPAFGREHRSQPAPGHALLAPMQGQVDPWPRRTSSREIRWRSTWGLCAETAGALNRPGQCGQGPQGTEEDTGRIGDNDNKSDKGAEGSSPSSNSGSAWAKRLHKATHADFSCSQKGLLQLRKVRWGGRA